MANNLPPIPPQGITASHSLEGEDRIISSILRSVIPHSDKKDIFYIDIGANHPSKESNTYLFYEMGFRGICVEPLTKYTESYQRIRPEDIHEDRVIGKENKTINFSVYEQDSSSSMHPETVERYDKKYDLIEVRKVKCITYKELLESYGIEDIEIPFVDIDVEGEDKNIFEQVVASKVKPLLICIENKLANIQKPYPSTEIDKIAMSHGYSLVAKTLLNSFFIKANSPFFEWMPEELKK